MQRTPVADKKITCVRRIAIQYGEICTTQSEELRKFLELMEVSADWESRRINKQSAHNLGGHPTRFCKEKAKIQVDEGWNTTLGSAELKARDLVAIRSNATRGYALNDSFH